MNKKQFIIGLVWVVIFAVIIGGIYLLIKPAPPVDNGNQNEPKEDLIILSQSFIPTLENNFDLVAKIKNSNNKWAVESFTYIFNLYDNANQLINSQQGKSYILPQETKYIIEQKVSSQKSISKIELKLSNISWTKLTQTSDLGLRVKNTEYQILEDGSNLLAGTVENKSSYDLDTIEVIGVLFNENNDIIAVGKTSMNTVLRNENRGFEIFWPYLIAQETKSFDARAYTNVFLNENFIEIQGEPPKE
jgi:hypothetical protein